MYLAGILALWALLCVPAWGHAGSEASSFALMKAASPSQNQPPNKTAQPDQSQTGGAQKTPQEPAQPDAANPKQEAQPAKPPASSKKHPHKKKSSTPSAQDAHTKVVHRGSTAEPTTQLTPEISQEQAARQRQNTNQLLASTDESLQKLSGRQLTKDEQETVTQIRKYMEQVKAADAAGDLQRAYKLAVKAHLLSDALVKP